MVVIKRKVIFVLICLVLGSALVGIAVVGATSSPVRIYYANPIVGTKPAYVTNALGFLARNGYAYSYVTLNINNIPVGAHFTIHPAINSMLQSASNLTIIVSFEDGTSFNYAIPQLDQSLSVTYGPPNADGPGSIFSSNLALSSGMPSQIAQMPAFITYELGSATNMTLFLYIGPGNMPAAP